MLMVPGFHTYLLPSSLQSHHKPKVLQVFFLCMARVAQVIPTINSRTPYGWSQGRGCKAWLSGRTAGLESIRLETLLASVWHGSLGRSVGCATISSYLVIRILPYLTPLGNESCLRRLLAAS